VRGFKDILPNESRHFFDIKKKFEEFSAKSGFDMIQLPFIEEANLYFRTSGEQSDLCNKELFEVRRYKDEFKDWVLKPEGTASCMRALKDSAYLQENKIAKFAYFDAMFRYNRPQKGRYRQFFQAGWEIIGCASVATDFEGIYSAFNFLKLLNIECVLEINTIGSVEDRNIYKEQLRNYFNLNQEDDPLKVIDKLDHLSSDIPKMQVNKEEEKRFQALLTLLEKFHVPYFHNPYLVRGLDYYNSTVFEFKIDGLSVLAGGRYDGLMDQISSANISSTVPAFGFAAGIERLMLYSKFEDIDQKIFLICLNEGQNINLIEYSVKVSNFLKKDYNVFAIWDLSLKKALNLANKLGLQKICIVGEVEMEQNIFIMKNLVNKIQENISIF